MQTPWEHRYAQRTQRMSGSAIREILKMTQIPGIISFAGGLPDPEVFPVEKIQTADKFLRPGLKSKFTSPPEIEGGN